MGSNIRKVGVLGLGTQGQGIVEVSARAGFDVLVATQSEASLTVGLSLVQQNLEKSVEKGRLTTEERDAALSRIKGTIRPEEFHDCDILIEAVREILEEKKEVFALYDGICKPETIITTDTSTLPIIEMAMATRRPGNVIGTHFFWPVPVMKLVEIGVAIVTSQRTVETVKWFCESIGKKPVAVKDSPGFITSYLIVAHSLEALRMYERGVASMEDIDTAVETGLNYPIGPFKLNDLAGIDTLYYSQRALWEMTKNPIFAPVLLLDKMMAAGQLGRKTGQGFYDYRKDQGP